MTWHLVLALSGQALAVDVTGQHLSDTIRTAGGNFFIAVLAVLGGLEMLKRRLLNVLGLLAVAAVAAIFVYQPGLVRDVGDALGRVLEGG